jgi:ADP-ribose pyrophosphatase YjhB (NUDIX family)
MYQKNILDKLRRQTTQKYSQLQPYGVESSHFKYHLNQLIKDGYVALESRGVYSLTTAGKAYVDRLSDTKINAHLTPKVITYTLLHDDHSYYLQTKNKEPYLGLLNMVGGKVHIGEQTNAASAREVHEKTGTHPISTPIFCGTAEVIVLQQNTILSHVIAFVYTATFTETATVTKIDKKKIGALSNLAPDTMQIIDAVEKQPHPFALQLHINL